MKVFFIFVVVSLLVTACNSKTAETGNDVIVSIDDKSLTRQELNEYIPQGLTAADSILAAENYIRHWIQDVLVYELASKNVIDKHRIDKLVENYRHSLTIHQYQEQLINQKLSGNISEKEIKQYYEEYDNKFILDIPLIKGMMIKIPVDAPRINDVKVWYKQNTSQARENLDKYIVQNAVSFDDFSHNWVSLDAISEKIPNHKLDKQLIQKKHIELQDSIYYYLISVTDYLMPGDPEPLEYAENNIKEFLVNQKKTDFLRKMENDLYNSALKNGRIRFYID